MIRAKDRVLVKKQAAWGTAETTGFFSLHLSGEPSVVYNGADFKSNRVRLDTAEAQFRKGNYSYTITLQVELEASQLVFMYQNMLGEYAFAADTPVASSNTHTIKLSDTAAELAQIAEKGFTLEIGGDAKFFTYDSCIVTSMEMGEIAQGVIPVTLTIMAREKAEAGATAGVYASDDNAQVLDTLQTVVSAGVDASEVVQPVRMVGLTITRPNVNPMYIMSSNLVQEWNIGDLTEISGTFEIQVTDAERAAVLDDFLNSDEFSMIIAATSDQLVTGATPYSVTIDMPECKYISIDSSTDGHNRFEKFGFRASVGGGTDAITVAMVNGEATFA